MCPSSASRNYCPAVLARQRLESSGYASLNSIHCSHKNGIVFIQGTIPSFYLKQVAQVRIRSIEGVIQVVKEIEVQNDCRSHLLGFSRNVTFDRTN